ncbi:spore germination protein GerPC [Paenibacillus sp. SI8]|uniref:spore germination protein GerPC n=1 Tax=unclassified Paenibacillus TaxID=185978 RepID=UPI0034663C99
MYMSSEWQRYLQQLHGYLHYQSNQIKELQGMMQQLLQEMNSLKQKCAQPATIRNEYKFDLLKVEKLSGTLNIGIKPNGTDSSIEEFAVEQSTNVASIENESPELFDDIQRHISEYFNDEAFQTLKNCEKNNHYNLDDPYRKFIVEDVKKQIDGRIQYYLNQVKKEATEREDDQFVQSITDKIKRDIEQTFDSFIRSLPKERNQ